MLMLIHSNLSGSDMNDNTNSELINHILVFSVIITRF